MLDSPSKSIGLEERKKETQETQEFVIYPTRWYVLFVYVWFSMQQCMYWSVFGTISNNAKTVYGIDNDDIALLANWGPVLFLITSIFWSWFLDAKGLRLAIGASMLCVLAGAVLRSITTEGSTAIFLIHLSEIINGAGGPVAMGACAKISETWFPVHERTTSTSIGSQAPIIGVAFGFLIGPLVVPDPDPGQVLLLFRIQTIAASIGLLALVVYFPTRPPSPPSFSAAYRIDKRALVQPNIDPHALSAPETNDVLTIKEFVLMAKKLLKMKDFIICCLCYGLTTGFLAGWESILDIIVENIGFDQKSAGWLGFTATLGGAILAIIIARFVDKYGHAKKVCSTLLVLSAISFFFFSFPSIGVSSESIQMLYLSGICGSAFIIAAIPIFYELSIEYAFPVLEGTVCIVLADMNNIGASLFLSMPIKKIGTSWVNISLACICIIATISLTFVEGKLKRLALDEGPQKRKASIMDAEYDRLEDPLLSNLED